MIAFHCFLSCYLHRRTSLSSVRQQLPPCVTGASGRHPDHGSADQRFRYPVVVANRVQGNTDASPDASCPRRPWSRVSPAFRDFHEFVTEEPNLFHLMEQLERLIESKRGNERDMWYSRSRSSPRPEDTARESDEILSFGPPSESH